MYWKESMAIMFGDWCFLSLVRRSSIDSHTSCSLPLQSCIPDRDKACCIVCAAPSSKELYSTLPKRLSSLIIWSRKLVFPLPEFPQTNQVPVASGLSKASNHGPCKSRSLYFLDRMSVTDRALFII